jgi:hypothetical protein
MENSFAHRPSSSGTLARIGWAYGDPMNSHCPDSMAARSLSSTSGVTRAMCSTVNPDASKTYFASGHRSRNTSMIVSYEARIVRSKKYGSRNA